MPKKRLSVHDTALLCGVSVRTLHHYDKIGLVCPERNSETKYRYYGIEDIARLQEVLFYRELGLELENIRAIIDSPENDRTSALEKHRELLRLKTKHYSEMLDAVDNILKGDITMADKNRTTQEDIDERTKEYADEVKQRWGKTDEYAQSVKKSAGRGKIDNEKIKSEEIEIFSDFAANRHSSPDSPEAMALVERWRAHITANFYNCTKVILAELGLMYEGDPRFAAHLDAYGEGTATFMAQAIREYCKKPD